MQIHELNNYNGDLDSNSYLAVDNGSDTGKISAQRFLSDVNSEIDQLGTDLNNRIDNIIAGGTAPSAAEVTDARLGADGVTYSSLGTAIRSQIANVTNDIQVASTGMETFGLYGDFVSGGLWRGNIVASESYRASSINILSFDRDINLYIESGYRIRLNIFVDGAYSSETAWFTGTYPIAKGTTFKIVIAKVSEDTSSTADVLTFLNAVKFESRNGYEINKHENGYNNLMDVDYISARYLGRYSRSGINNGPLYPAQRWRTSSTIIQHTNRDLTVLVVEQGFRFDVVFYSDDQNETMISESGWITGKYIIPKDSYFRLLIARVTEDTTEYANIDEFANALGVFSSFSDVANTVNGYEAANQGDLVTGTFENNQLNVSEAKRARTNYVYIEQPTELTITANDDYYWIVKGSSVVNGVLQESEDYVAAWNHTNQTLILQKGVYVLVVANGSTYGTSTNYDITNPSIRFSFVALPLSEAIDKIMSGAQSNEILTSKYAVELPNYWEEYMDNKLPDIISQVRSAAMTGDSFVFFTDYHIEYNSGNSHLLMNRILNNTPLDMVVFGGDIMNGSATKAEGYAKCQEFAQRFRKLPMFGIRGNHEYNLDDGGSASVKFSDNEIYNYLIKQSERKIKGPGKMYYYVDNEPQKIRYIFLDSKNQYGYDDYPMDDAQLEWLTSILSELTDKWKVVIFVHQFMGKSYEDHTWYVTANGERIENAIAESNTAATICAIISGHWHEDYSMIKNGVPYIVTTWDGYYADSDRTRGTTTELAFDVFTINTSDKTIKTTRIGYGEDRSWTYGE